MIVNARLTGQRSCRVDGSITQISFIQRKMMYVIQYDIHPIRAQCFLVHRLEEIKIPMLPHIKLHTANEPGSTERGKPARIFQCNIIWLNLRS